MSVSPAVTVPLASASLLSDRLLTTVNEGAVGTAVLTVASGELTGTPVGETPDAVALLSIAPASASAWVTTYVAVHVMKAPGANVVVAQVGAETPGLESLIRRLETVTLPVLVTLNV